ncbi:spermatogenesis-associated protein 20 [Pogonomyrmex barbatus]|uniref:Spermatogenesis-associated protein 20 n=1 Tax=Pogonomyrmex barbatus TaxID=144034 RepID=A0A6I9WL75_9HYME|nr:spermatogenesis-associated protein 20 [Pogonomyrmex barbatus]XP_025075145.1 spermatogenesis-associated protein 20 [Pogonomyrmex barbatus]
MISGRCSLLSIVRRLSEKSKQQCCTEAQKNGCSKRSHLTESAVARHINRNRANHNTALFLSSFVRMASTSQDSDKNIDCSEAKKNWLSLEKSPYLLQHATNPVEWYPWGDKALERAKKENKIIFVSIGYSTCHWCHVMERESFKDKKVAKAMNENYINIKVDREERPDIDSMCMMFIQRFTGHGGWPLNVFLTPDLMPIIGGTYIPRETFLTYLTRIAKEWTQQKDKMIKSANVITESLNGLVKTKPKTKDDGLPPLESVLLCAHMLMDMYDSENGGFSSSAMSINSPKFPEPTNLNFVLSMHVLSNSSALSEMTLEAGLHTLKKMSYGGIHDHVGQGFHRYSVDTQWAVPHFEKMLYDQAQLIQCYANAYVITKDSFFSNIVDDIATYVTRDLRHKEGGFYSAEDADSLPTWDASAKQEGAFYVWTYDNLKALLNKKVPGKDNVTYFDLICRRFSVQKAGNVRKEQDHHGELKGKNVLSSKLGVEDTASHFNFTEEETEKYIKEACQILFEERSKRPRPQLDDKIITAWNGLMISGFARAGIALKNEKYVELATDAARFVERYLFDKDKRQLFRSCYRGKDDEIVQGNVPIYGFHDDYAFLTKGLLDLYEANFDSHWIEFANELQDIQDKLFWDSQNGGYFSTTGEGPTILTRMKDSDDGAEPSGNSIACSNMLRLAICLDRDDLRNKAEKLLIAFRNKIMNFPIVSPQMLLSLIEYHHSMQIYVTGKVDAKETMEMLNLIRERMIPGSVLILTDPEQRDNILFHKNSVISKIKPAKNAMVHICRGQECSLPISSIKHLISELNKIKIADL